MDPLTIGMLAILAVLIFFMFRNGQKRKKDQEALLSKVVPGAEVMTNFGLYGTIISIDEEANKVQLETSPGNVLTVHRQTVARVIDEEPVADEVATDDDETPRVQLNEDNAHFVGEPEFGERIDEADSAAEKKDKDSGQ